MVHIAKFIPVIILVVISISLLMGEEYIQTYKEQVPFVIKYRIHLGVASFVAAIAYYLLFIKHVKAVVEERYDDYLPSYDESNMSYSL